jgi:hypothetical protein
VRRIGEPGTTLAVSSVRRLIVTANVVPSSLILVTLMMEALRSSRTLVLTRATILHNPIFVVRAGENDDYDGDNNNNNNNNNSIQFFIIYVSEQLQGQLQTQHSADIDYYIMDKYNIKSRSQG